MSKPNEFSYDDIYGLDIQEYCDFHGVSIDSLIEKVQKDILLLEKRFQEEFVIDVTSENYNSPLSRAIYKLLRSKIKHLDRLLAWKNFRINQ